MHVPFTQYSVAAAHSSMSKYIIYLLIITNTVQIDIKFNVYENGWIINVNRYSKLAETFLSIMVSLGFDFDWVSICILWINNLMRNHIILPISQVVPVKPLKHVHSKEPSLLVQLPSLHIPSARHSFTSEFAKLNCT